MEFSEALKSNLDFQTVYHDKRSFANRFFVMYVRKNGTDRNRIGISVSKKVGNSVIRHRIKRLIRESYRLQEKMFHSGWDIVIVARPSAAEMDFQQAKSALIHVGNLQHIINK